VCVWRTVFVILAIGAVGSAAAGAGVGHSAGDAERRAILRTMEAGRTSLLARDAKAACARLTAKGRRRSLAFKVDFDQGGTIPPDSPRLPQTCEEIVRREWQAIRECRRCDESWPRDLRHGSFSVVSVRDGRAKVRLAVGDVRSAAVFWLVKSSRGWLIDDSDALPSGH
jgi:hypothetical protein